MKILVLSFYFEPDLCAGSFRTTALVEKLSQQPGVEIEVITTLPNRYASFSAEALVHEQRENTTIHRIELPSHQSGMVDQAKTFFSYHQQVMKIVNSQSYDMVYATSSRLFTALLGARIARKKKLPLYLDIRDIFVDTIGDVFSKKITWLLKPIFSFIESYAFSTASRINLVSEGFKGYFESRYPDIEYRWFTNGIDEEFLTPLKVNVNRKSEIIKILYAGNIGEGQGLHEILPKLSTALQGKAEITIIGDGGRKALLEGRLLGSTNVMFLPPVGRNELIELYKNADILFLHLNDYPAFEKVLPSKIFEYSALGKPILAGVSGYAAKFLSEEVGNSATFYPGDSKGALNALSTLDLNDLDRTSFKSKFSRSEIMKNMAVDIVEFVSNDGR
ncbi:glycosyltransferase family 4 protein [Oceaniserpentilla sp. 4NH20-0058]|uniref:glycosyltransferase family 4 protein n=1 Tax=Oceaniserpentilla sp. 4NH20-0058 TaxID=3127660 RepID=UPI003109A4F9